MPPSACSKTPRASPIGAGEGAALVAEELALDQRRRDRGAVDDDEGAGAPGGDVVDGARHQLLAGARLPVRSRVASVGATRSSTAKTWRMGSDRPISPHSSSRSLTGWPGLSGDPQRGLPQPDGAAHRHPYLGDARVEVDSDCGSQVPHLHRAGEQLEGGMPAGDRAVVEHQRAGGVAAGEHRALAQLDPSALPRPVHRFDGDGGDGLVRPLGQPLRPQWICEGARPGPSGPPSIALPRRRWNGRQ